MENILCLCAYCADVALVLIMVETFHNQTIQMHDVFA